MAKKINKDAENTEKVKPKKKKMSAHEKRKLGIKIIGWIMAITMILGTLLSIFGMLAYR